ncbi:MAG: hypothetical protein U0237_12290 [Thermoleophilia bacterium]
MPPPSCGVRGSIAVSMSAMWAGRTPPGRPSPSSLPDGPAGPVPRAAGAR